MFEIGLFKLFLYKCRTNLKKKILGDKMTSGYVAVFNTNANNSGYVSLFSSASKGGETAGSVAYAGGETAGSVASSSTGASFSSGSSCGGFSSCGSFSAIA